MNFSNLNTQLPPLPKCIVVDSKFSSRERISADLRAANLFQEIIVAKSLMDALQKLAMSEYNACVIGASVSIDKAVTFAEKSREIESCERMALFVMAKQGEDEETLKKRVGAHGTIKYPYEVEKFVDQVVRSVISADSKCEWLKVISEINCELRDKERKDTDSTNTETTEDGNFILSILDNLVTGMAVLSKGIKAGLYGLGPNGNFTKETHWAVQSLTEHIFKGRKKTITITEFQQYLQFAILEWFNDMNAITEEAALRKFQDTLRLFNQNVQ